MNTVITKYMTFNTHNIEKNWREQRINLSNYLHKFPNSRLNVIDSAYLAGLEASQAHTKEEVIREVLEIVGDPIRKMSYSNSDWIDGNNNQIDRLRQAITNLREMK